MIVLVDKPSGMTSHDVVAQIKKAAGDPKLKIGHAGTLDPMCTGVLPVLTGKYTKLLGLFPSVKSYRAGLRLGVTTTTEDITGDILEKRNVAVTDEEVAAAVAQFTGEIYQKPPMYSAVKIGGEKLYHLARQGITIERPERKIQIFSAGCRKAVEKDEYILDISCSSGTYIRTLCADIGKMLGCGGCMSFLVRTGSNGFCLSKCHELQDVLALAEQGRIAEIAIGCEEAFSTCPRAVLPDDAVRYYQNGGQIGKARVLTEQYGQDTPFLVYTQKNVFLGLGRFQPNNCLQAVWNDEKEEV